MHCAAPPVDAESSVHSGSVFKEHDYIGLAEVSSSIAPPHADGDEGASPLHLNMEETDLRLGLGPVKTKEGLLVCEKTPRVFLPSREWENPTKAMAGVDDHRPSQLHVWQSKQLWGAENPEEGQRFLPAHSITARPASTTSSVSTKNGTKRGYSITTDAPKIGIAVDAKPLASAGGSLRGMNAENDVKNLSKPQQNAFLPSWPMSKPASSTPWHVGPEEPVNAYVSNTSRAVKPAVATYKQHDHSSVITSDDAPPSKNQVVGWPPVGIYRKQQTPAKPAEMFVKVNMDGITVGRKVDLNLHSSYDGLFQALEDMFQPSIHDKHLQLRNGSDFVLIYEDRDGDWMLVGDVPWSLFLTTVRRLLILRGSEVTGLDAK